MHSYKILILTVSDRLFTLSAADSFSAALFDEAGNAVEELVFRSFEGCIVKRRITNDDAERLVEELVNSSAFASTTNTNTNDSSDSDFDARKFDLILTCGGSGFGVRDSTPEAIRKVIEKEASGLSIAMLTNSLQKTPFAALSRPVCGVRGSTLIVSLPGSTKGAVENLDSIISVLPHALELIRGSRDAGDSFHGPHPATKYRTELNINHSESKSISPSNGPRPATELTHSATELKSKSKSVIHNCTHHRHSEKEESIKQNVASMSKSNDPSQSVTKRARASPYPMISFQDAFNLVIKYSSNPSEERHIIAKNISDPSLVGCVLAQDVISKESVPSYRASIVDGYALHHSTLPGIYSVQANSHVAGSPQPQTQTILEPGSIARITTGAPVPNGATAVIMVEDTDLIETSKDGLAETRVATTTTLLENENIRPVGCDVAVGEMVLSKGQVITSVGGEIGVLASIGQATVNVYRKPKVAILSTGNELLEASYTGTIPHGAIRDSNRPALAQIIQANGYEVIDLGIAGDSIESLETALRKGLDWADVVVTTGGVSMGEKDLLKPVIERRLNGTIHFGRVALKPGKPTTFATVPDSSSSKEPKLIFALPGNPVSALVTFRLFVLPSLKKKAGHENVNHQLLKVKLSHDIKLDPRPEFYRVILSNTGDSHWIATGTGGVQLSSRVLSMASATGLLQLPPKGQNVVDAMLKAGSLVDCILL